MTHTPFATAGRYRISPVIEAFRYDGSNFDGPRTRSGAVDSVRITRKLRAGGGSERRLNRDFRLRPCQGSRQSEQDSAARANPNDLVLRSVSGGLAVCASAVFDKTYEPVAIA